jgi:hypothetical protein
LRGVGAENAALRIAPASGQRTEVTATLTVMPYSVHQKRRCGFGFPFPEIGFGIWDWDGMNGLTEVELSCVVLCCVARAAHLCPFAGYICK